MSISFDFIISVIAICIACMLFIRILNDFDIKLEMRHAKDTEFSDTCNILYITNFGMKTSQIKYENDWCLSPKVQAGDFVYIKQWYDYELPD